MNLLALFSSVKVFVFDVDGVMTDGTLQLMENGALSRKMHIRDGYALQWAVKQGYPIVVISGGKSKPVIQRLKSLGVNDVFTGVSDKQMILANYLEDHEISPDSVLYMGDDLPDYDAMKMVGLAACPADAAPEIKSISQYISPLKGGNGCVRDVIEKVLKLNGRWKEE